MALAQAASVVASLILTPLELAAMGATRYGLVAIASACAAYITFADIGGGWALMRYIPLYRSQGKDREANEAFTIALCGSAVVGLLGAGVLSVLAPIVAKAFISERDGLSGTAVAALQVSALWLPTLLVLGVLTGVGRVIGRFRLTAGLSAGGVVLFNLMWFAIAKTTRSPAEVMWAQVAVTGMAGAVWSIVIYMDKSAPRLCRVRRSTPAWGLIGFSALNSVGEVGLMLLTTLDKVLVAAIIGPSALVYYAIPFSLAQRLTIVSSSVASVAFPSLSVERKDELSSVDRVLIDSKAIVGIPTITLTAVGIWAGPAAISLWISPTFAQRSAGPLRELLIGFCILSLSSIYHVNLEALGRIRLTTMITVIPGAIGLVLCWGCGQLFGITGAAVGISSGLIALGGGIIIASTRLIGSPRSVDIRAAGALIAIFMVTGALLWSAIQTTAPPGEAKSILTVVLTCGVMGLLGLLVVKTVLWRNRSELAG